MRLFKRSSSRNSSSNKEEELEQQIELEEEENGDSTSTSRSNNQNSNKTNTNNSNNSRSWRSPRGNNSKQQQQQHQQQSSKQKNNTNNSSSREEDLKQLKQQQKQQNKLQLKKQQHHDNSNSNSQHDNQLDKASAASASAPPPPPPPSHHPTTSSTMIRYKKSVPSLNSYATTPISKHYELNQLVLQAFDAHYQAGLWQTAFTVGLQFCETALLEIPKHGYYYSPRHERERMQNSLEAARVANLLQDIITHEQQQQQQQQQHANRQTLSSLGPSLITSPPAVARVETLQALAVESVQQASQSQDRNATIKWEQQRAAVERNLRTSEKDNASVATATATTEWILLEPFLSCQDSISNVLCPSPPSAVHEEVQVYKDSDKDDDSCEFDHLPVAVALPFEKHRTADHVLASPVATTLMPSSHGGGHNRSHNTHANNDWIHVRRHSAEDILLEKALYLSGLEILAPTSTSVIMEQDELMTSKSSAVEASHVVHDMAALVGDVVEEEDTKQPSSSVLQLETVSQLYHEDFDALVHNGSGRIRITYVNTFQGREPGSINGCTVIAPLLCIHHLLLSNLDSNAADSNDDDDAGLSTLDIRHVIDDETPAVLSQVRERLGLAEHSFLIPADVHDYLLEQGQLHSSQFVNVVGGNILDDQHVQNLMQALVVGDNNNKRRKNKLAATLYFCEHVIAILKVVQEGRHCYHVIDSLPLQATFARPHHNHDKKQSPWEDIGDDFGDDDMNDNACLEQTTVVQCRDEAALVCFLRWYACSKFTAEHVAYIDSYEWDDRGSDFDPRVFQAHLWATCRSD